MTDMVRRLAKSLVAYKCAVGFKDMIFGGGPADFDLLAPQVQEYYFGEVRNFLRELREIYQNEIDGEVK